MKPTNERGGFSQRLGRGLTRARLVAVFWLVLLALPARAFVPIEPYATNLYVPLGSWSFNDTNFWTSDQGNYPLSFTNLSASDLGDPVALVVNSAKPAWLSFPIVNTHGTTNLTVAVGSVTLWYAPAWASVSQGGNGPNEGTAPGQFARLLEVGGYTPAASFGLWSLYVDDAGSNVCFSAQTNDFSSNFCTYVTAPVAWVSNDWHFIAFTYSATNTALYVDGVLATNGPPITNYPGALALANGMFMGSDSNGIYQAEGMLDDVETYNGPMDAGTIAHIFSYDSIYYYGNPLNEANLQPAGFTPPTNGTYTEIFTGMGNLQWVSSVACAGAGDTNGVWLTNVTTTATGNGMRALTFSIAGGACGVAYDVFANSVLSFGTNGVPWTWMGQGSPYNTYTLTGLPNQGCFLILGTPLDPEGDGLTEAYELLVSKTNPFSPGSDPDGLPNGWEALLGLTGQVDNPGQSTWRANYGYTAADWLDEVTGIKSGAITNDPEGNVQVVAQ